MRRASTRYTRTFPSDCRDDLRRSIAPVDHRAILPSAEGGHGFVVALQGTLKKVWDHRRRPNVLRFSREGAMELSLVEHQAYAPSSAASAC